MILVTELLGISSEPQFSSQLHDLSHEGKVEVVRIDPTDAQRRRLRTKTDRGTEVLVALEKGQQLSDGAVLVCELHRAIVARVSQERWLRVSPRDSSSAMEVGYFIGNLHWRVHFDHGDILVAVEGNIEDYEARLLHFVENSRISLAKDN